MKTEVPKQFLELGGMPVIFHTLRAFLKADPSFQILVSLPESFLPQWDILCKKYEFHPALKVVTGGLTRFHSISNALSAIREEGLVAVHDSVRPFITPSFILRLFSEAIDYGSAVPVIPLQDSLRRVTKEGSFPLPREEYRLVQTPQVFSVTELQKAYDQPFSEKFTDDASVFESICDLVHLTEGEPFNFKITCPADMFLAEAMISRYPSFG